MRRKQVCGSLAVSLIVCLAVAGTATAQSWTELIPVPDPVVGLPEVASHTAGVFDPATNQMIVFGGVGPFGSPPHGLSSEVWRLTGANGLGGTPTWIKVTPGGPTPAPRKWAEAGYDPAANRMIVFGGALGGSSPCTSQVWVLDDANGVPGNPTWILLAPGGGPAARFWHSAVYDPTSNRLIVYGGSNCFGAADFNDVWVLTNANGLGGTPAWIQLFPSGVVGAISRDTHEAVYDPASNRMIVFGGRNPASVARNDVWVLTNANGLGGTPAWIQLFPTGPLPAERAVPSGVYDPIGNRFLVFGGGGPSGPMNDVWVLSNANGTAAASPAWTELNPTSPLPAGRAFPTGVYDSINDRMTIFRGSDGVQSFNDVWVLSNTSGVLAPEEQVELLIGDVEDLVDGDTLNQGQGNALTSKLGNALKSLGKGNDVAAMNQILAFVNQVEALMKGKRPVLTPEQGQALIDAGNSIFDQILGSA